MYASRLAEIIPVWASYSGYIFLSAGSDSRCGAVLEAAAQLRLVISTTVSLAHKNYGAISTYPIGRDRWKLVRLFSSDKCGGTKKSRCRRYSGRI